MHYEFSCREKRNFWQFRNNFYNTRSNTARAITKLQELGEIELIPHPAYNPELALSENMEEFWLKMQRFGFDPRAVEM